MSQTRQFDSESSVGEQTTSNGPTVKAIVLALAMLAAVAVAGFVGYSIALSDSPAETTSKPAIGKTTEPTEEVASPTASLNQVTRADGSIVDTDKFFLQLNKDYSVNAVGKISDPEIFGLFQSKAEKTFEPYGNFKGVEFDASLEPRQWEAGTPVLVTALAALLNGSIEVTDTETIVSGEVPKIAQLGNLISVLENEEFGFPPVNTDNVVEVEVAEPEIAIAGRGDKVEISGRLPDLVHKTIVAELVKEYGENNVTDNMVSDDTTFARFQLIRFGQYAANMKPLENYELGVAEVTIYVSLNEGATFASNETALSEDKEGPVLKATELFQFINAPIFITGFTDNVGGKEYNEELSLVRAESVKSLLVENTTIAADRITTEGRGAVQFVADNDTEDNRAKNRRVEISLTRKDEPGVRD